MKYGYLPDTKGVGNIIDSQAIHQAIKDFQKMVHLNATGESLIYIIYTSCSMYNVIYLFIYCKSVVNVDP